MRFTIFCFKSHCCVFLMNQLTKVCDGSGYSLAPNMWQTITWANDDPGWWRKCESSGLDVLTRQCSMETVVNDKSSYHASISWFASLSIQLHFFIFLNSLPLEWCCLQDWNINCIVKFTTGNTTCSLKTTYLRHALSHSEWLIVAGVEVNEC